MTFATTLLNPFVHLAGRRWTSAFAGLLALVTLTACQAQGTVTPAPGTSEAALRARIQAEVGDASCTSDAQCRTLPIGEKACGGPASWLAWSTQRSQAERLKPLSEALAALDRRRNEQGGMLSNCQFNADPGAQCRGGRCSLRDRSVAN